MCVCVRVCVRVCACVCVRVCVWCWVSCLPLLVLVWCWHRIDACLGCLAYELCTLSPPFLASNQIALAK